MATFIVADLHFGDERIGILGRPFRNAEEMQDALMWNIKLRVSNEDTLIFNGDVCNKDKPELIALVSKIEAKYKILIKGNHDAKIPNTDLYKYFDVVYEDGKGLDMPDLFEGLPVYITHYPTEGRKDRFNLVGHIHAAWKYQLNMFNVGVDANHFFPVNMETIPAHFKAICEFYDNDIWVAYNEINQQFVGKRGMKGTYFRGK